MISQECTFIREQFLENAPRHGWLLGKEVLFFRGETKLSLVSCGFPRLPRCRVAPGVALQSAADLLRFGGFEDAIFTSLDRRKTGPPGADFRISVEMGLNPIQRD